MDFMAALYRLCGTVKASSSGLCLKPPGSSKFDTGRETQSSWSYLLHCNWTETSETSWGRPWRRPQLLTLFRILLEWADWLSWISIFPIFRWWNHYFGLVKLVKSPFSLAFTPIFVGCILSLPTSFPVVSSMFRIYSSIPTRITIYIPKKTSWNP